MRSAQSVLGLMQRAEPPMVLAIDGPRGSGRSSYVQFIARLVEPSSELVPFWIDAPSYNDHSYLLPPIINQLSREFSQSPELTDLASRFVTDHSYLRERRHLVSEGSLHNEPYESIRRRIDVQTAPAPQGLDLFLTVERIQDLYLNFIQGAAANANARAFVGIVDDLDHCEPAVIERFFRDVFAFTSIPGSRIIWLVTLDSETFLSENGARRQLLLEKVVNLSLRTPASSSLRPLMTAHANSLGLNEAKVILNTLGEFIDSIGLHNPRAVKRIVSRLAYIKTFGAYPKNPGEENLLFGLVSLRELFPRVFRLFETDPGSALMALASVGNGFGNSNFSASTLGPNLRPLRDEFVLEMNSHTFHKILGQIGAQSLTYFNLRSGQTNEAIPRFLQYIRQVDQVF